MAYAEFTGELDAPETGAFVPFSGELDEVRSLDKPDTSDPLTRVTPSASSTNPTFTASPISAETGPGVGERVAGELGQLRDEFFSGVDQAAAGVSNVNTSIYAKSLASVEAKVKDLEARGSGDSNSARRLRAEAASLRERIPGRIAITAQDNAAAQRGSRMVTRPVVQKMGEAKTLGEAWTAFKEDPYGAIAGVTAQSMPTMLPALVAGAVAGPAVGALAMGGSSGLVEFGSSLSDFAREAGVDVADPKALQAFYTDPKALSEALSYAGKRAGIIGTLDAASAKIAGKVLAPAVKSAVGRQAVNVPTQMAAQAAAGAGGEAGAQLATKGEIDQPGQVLLEAVGELGGAPLEVAAFGRNAVRPQEPVRDLTPEILSAPTVDAAIATATEAVSQPVAQPAVQPESVEAVDNIAKILGVAPEAEVAPAQTAPAIVEPVVTAPENVPAAVPEGQPSVTWFGRRGDGYTTANDAGMALQSRQKARPDLEWKVEPTLEGRFRLAGYAPVTSEQGFTFQFTPAGTLAVQGDPQAIKSTLAEAGITSVALSPTGARVGVSQAQAAAQALTKGTTDAGATVADERAVQPGMDGRSPELGRGEPAGGLGDSGLRPAGQPATGSAAAVPVAAEGGQPGAVVAPLAGPAVQSQDAAANTGIPIPNPVGRPEGTGEAGRTPAAISDDGVGIDAGEGRGQREVAGRGAIPAVGPLEQRSQANAEVTQTPPQSGVSSAPEEVRPAPMPFYVVNPSTNERIPVASPEDAAGRFKEVAARTGMATMDIYDAKTGQPAFNLLPDGRFRKVETLQEVQARAEKAAREAAPALPAPAPEKPTAPAKPEVKGTAAPEAAKAPEPDKPTERERIAAMQEAAKQRKEAEAAAKTERRAAEMERARGTTGKGSDSALAAMVEKRKEVPAADADQAPLFARGESKLVAAWQAIASSDDAFKYPRSDSTDLMEVFATVAPDIEIEPHISKDDVVRSWRFNTSTDHARYGYVMEYDDGRIEMNVPLVKAGSGGSAAYAAVGNWVFNTGKKFAPDRFGLKELGRTRRIENMASLALKFGTTDFFDMSKDSLGIAWKDGDTAANIEALLKAGYENVAAKLPKIKEYSYDFKIQRVVSTAEALPGGLPGQEAQSVAERLADQARAAGLSVGPATIQRAILTGTLLRGQALLSQVRAAVNKARPDAVLSGVLYSKGEGQAGLTRSQFTSAIAKAFGPKVAERLESNGVVVPLEDQSSLPDRVVPFVRDNGVVYGYYDPISDKTYAVLENLSPDMVKGLVLHEVGIHYGFEQMLGKEKYAKVIARVKLMGKAGNKQVIAARDQAKQNSSNEAQIPEETLAYLVGANPEMTLVQEVVARIKAFLFGKFGIGANYLTANDMTALARAAVLHSSRADPGARRPDFATGETMFASAGRLTSAAFKRWFGDSKVVDADGKPLVVYHGTAAGEPIEKFGGLVYAGWFTPDAKKADVYTRMDEGEEDGAVYPAYLAISNPLDLSALDGNDEFDAKAMAAAMGVPAQEVQDLFDNVADSSQNWSLVDTLEFREWVEALGKDGVKIKEGGALTWAALRPNQIKSAIGNRGTFDQTNADIRFSRSAITATEPEAAPTTSELSPWRDATGRLQFAPGAWLWDKLGDAAGPLLAKVGLKTASPELRRQLRKMRLTVQAAQEKAAAVAAETNKLTAEERAMVSDLIEQELTAGTVPPDHAVRLAALINESMNVQTDELVRLGMLTKDSADMWRGKYLPRYYKSKLTKQVSDAWADALYRMTGRQRVMAGIKGKHLKGRGLYETVAASAVAEWEALGWEVRDPDHSGGASEISQKILNGEISPEDTVQVWRDFTRQERDSMGEIRDAGFRFVMGYMQTQRDIALGRMFEGLAADAEMSAKRESERFNVQVPDGTVPGTGAKRYGKLAGRWVPKEVMSHLSQIEESQSEAWRMYRKALAIWKEGKTALNPVAHVNNTVSNLTMAHLAGVSYHRADKYIAAARDFATKSPRIKEAKDAGLFLGTMSDAELMNVLPEDLKVLVRQQDSAATKIGRTGFNMMTFWLRRPMGWAYQAEDTFFRYLIWKDATDRGMSADDAVDQAQRYIFAYDDLPKGARMIRDFGIPFFSYTYKAAPALLYSALAHPFRMAAPAAVLWAINAAAYAIASGDDDESWDQKLKRYLTDEDFREEVRKKEKLEREFLPSWNKGTTALGTPKMIRLGMDELTKLPLFIDVSRIIPGGDLFDVSPNAGGIPLPQPITPSHPLFTTAVAMIGNKDLFRGKELVDKNDTRGEATEKRLEWLWTQLTPAIAAGSYHWDRTMNAIAQASGGEIKWLPEVLAEDYTGIGRDGLPVQAKYAAMQTFGVKVRPMDLDKSEEIDQSMQKKMVREIDAEMRSLKRLNNLGAVSDKTYEKARDLADIKKERIKEGKTVDGEDKD